MQTQTKISGIKFVKYKNLMVIKNIVKVLFNIGKCVIYFKNKNVFYFFIFLGSSSNRFVLNGVNLFFRQ